MPPRMIENSQEYRESCNPAEDRGSHVSSTAAGPVDSECFRDRIRNPPRSHKGQFHNQPVFSDIGQHALQTGVFMPAFS